MEFLLEYHFKLEGNHKFFSVNFIFLLIDKLNKTKENMDLEGFTKKYVGKTYVKPEAEAPKDLNKDQVFISDKLIKFTPFFLKDVIPNF